MFLARYIEKFGTGTIMMIRECSESDLPEPEFEQRGAEFVVTLWRDWLTPGALDALGVNERQRLALLAAKSKGTLTNAEYQHVAGTSRPTAKRDLEDLVSKGVLLRKGAGRGAYYQLARKRLRNGSISS
jgi:predicted HTH transcriptional regulator